MAVTHVATNTGFGVGSASVSTPGSPGDFLLAVVDGRSSGALTADEGGWSTVEPSELAPGSTCTMITLSRTRSAGDPSSFGFTHAGGLQMAAVLAAYSPATIDNSAIAGHDNSVSSTTTPCPSNTVANDGSIRIVAMANRDPDADADVTPPSGFTERAEVNSGTGSNDIGLAIADIAVDIADSPTGVSSWSHNALTFNRIGFSIVLAESAAGTITPTLSLLGVGT